MHQQLASTTVSRRARGVEAQGAQRRRILVVDDNEDSAATLSRLLAFLGNDVRVAQDGVEAVKTARRFAPNVTIMDLNMPRMDGYEAARQIRQTLGPDVMLVALTGWGQDEDKRRSKEAGFDHHLTKPPDPEVLERLIAECAKKER